MVKLADDYFDSMDPNSPTKRRDYSPRKEDNIVKDVEPPRSFRSTTFSSNAFLLEENAPTVVAGKATFVQRDANKAHFKLRQVTLGLTLKQASQALRISLTQANDLEQGRLRCDWKLAARMLKRAAERF